MSFKHISTHIDYEQDDMQFAIAEWMAIPKNHKLFFEEICKKIDEKDSDSLKSALLPILERLSQEWNCLAQRWVVNDSLFMKAGPLLCNDFDDKNLAEEKREEARELFIEAAKDLVIGSVEVVETIVLTEINPFGPSNS